MDGLPSPVEEAFERVTHEEASLLDELTRQERTFLTRYVMTGDAYTAAVDAGYSIVYAMTASVLLDKPHIRKALKAVRATQRESLRQRQINEAMRATGILSQMMADNDMVPQVRLAAAMKLIDASGATAAGEMKESLKDDAPLEKIKHDKSKLALVEFKKTKDTVI